MILFLQTDCCVTPSILSSCSRLGMTLSVLTSSYLQHSFFNKNNYFDAFDENLRMRLICKRGLFLQCMGHLEWLLNLRSMFLDYVRKPECPEKRRGERANSTQKNLSLESNQRLFRFKAKVLTAAPPSSPTRITFMKNETINKRYFLENKLLISELLL